MIGGDQSENIGTKLQMKKILYIDYTKNGNPWWKKIEAAA